MVDKEHVAEPPNAQARREVEERRDASAMELLDEALNRRFLDRLMASALHEIGNLVSRHAIGCITPVQAMVLIRERLRYLDALAHTEGDFELLECRVFSRLNDDLSGEEAQVDYPAGRNPRPPGTEVALSNSNSKSEIEIETPKQNLEIRTRDRSSVRSRRLRSGFEISFLDFDFRFAKPVGPPTIRRGEGGAA